MDTKREASAYNSEPTIKMNKNSLMIEVGGYCITKSIEEWHKLGKLSTPRLTDWGKIDKSLQNLYEYFCLKNLDLKEPERELIDSFNVVMEFVEKCIKNKYMNEPRLMEECPSICENTNCVNYSKTCVIGKNDTCPDCGGTGRWGINEAFCWNCKGTGKKPSVREKGGMK